MEKLKIKSPVINDALADLGPENSGWSNLGNTLIHH